jgi:acyl carrier protein
MQTLTEAAVRQLIAEAAGRRPSELSPDTPLGELCPDSFQLVEVIVDLQEQLGVTIVQENLRSTRTVGQLAALFAARVG